MSGVAPGWYKDPADPATQRYWDGEGWLGEPLPADAPTPAEPPRMELTPPPAPVEPAPVAPTSPPTPEPPPMPEPPPVPGARSYGPPPPEYAVPPPQWSGYAMGLPVPRPHGLALAPLGTRLVARLIDIFLVLLLNVIVNGWFVIEYLREALPVSRRMAETGDWLGANAEVSSRAGWLELVILVVATGLWFAYEVPAVANSGQTIGKRLVGIRVVGLESTRPLGFSRAFRRWRPLGLPTLLWFCCIGFVWQFFYSLSAAIDQPMHQAIHDKSARTVVVYAPKTPEVPHDPADPS